jgi:hypothetical protein
MSVQIQDCFSEVTSLRIDPAARNAHFCESCSRIPFGLLLSNDDQTPPSVVFTVGTVSDIESRQHCALCEICKDVLEEEDLKDWKDTIQRRRSYENECTFCVLPKSCNVYPGDHDEQGWYQMRMPMCLHLGPHAILEFDLWGFGRSDNPRFITQPACSVGIASVPQSAKTWFDRAQWLSDDDIKRLMQGALRCKQHYKSCDGPIRPMTQAPKLRLIDVQDRTLKWSDAYSQYVTLSYMWGKSTRHTSKDCES